MKKAILLVASFFGLFHFTSAQIEFAPPGAKWTFDYEFDATDFHWKGIEEISYVGDTIIEGQSAKKLLVVRTYLDLFGSLSDTIVEHRGTRYIFQQGDEISLYYENAFRPIYRFNLSVGEEMQVLYNGEIDLADNIEITVDSIKLISVQGQQRKILHTRKYCELIDLDELEYVSILEGIGFIDNYLFFNETSCISAIGGVVPLFRCYQENEEVIYKREDAPFCDELVLVSEETVNKHEEKLKIFPNPIHEGQLTIEFPSLSKGLLNIYGPTGRLIEQREITDLSEKLSLANYANGIYILHYWDTVSNKNYVARFINN